MKLFLFFVYMMFPFLIGKVLTNVKALWLMPSRWLLFPFLIGKVLTTNLCSRISFIKVSIPYR